MQPVGNVLRKRAQIASASRTMFTWVVAVSIVFGFALVGAVFLIQMLMFNERVLIEKGKTVKNLNANIAVVDTIESSVKKLDANQALIDSKAKSDDQAIQAILDALPSDANSLALGASLQNRLLTNINNMTLESLQVTTVAGVEQLSNGQTASNSDLSTSQNEIDFTFSVSGDDAALKQVLTNLEASIRTIDVVSLQIDSAGDRRTMSVKARAFYEPAVKVELKDKVVK